MKFPPTLSLPALLGLAALAHLSTAFADDVGRVSAPSSRGTFDVLINPPTENVTFGKASTESLLESHVGGKCLVTVQDATLSETSPLVSIQASGELKLDGRAMYTCEKASVVDPFRNLTRLERSEPARLTGDDFKASLEEALRKNRPICDDCMMRCKRVCDASGQNCEWHCI